ncbi:MAG: AarF/ABC1/UbiB kinase family protein [Halobacteriovoraceae bacterium]|nr:AarF/ABC1/UbiB kinase family protein [Halobacteriovoraceae bacterium]MCB9095230.1 AarF/ABC1/UbiB kinase family protein [Halobacteriovoraceae bacterium]
MLSKIKEQKLTPFLSTVSRINRVLIYNSIFKMPLRLLKVSKCDGFKNFPENLTGEFMADVLEESGPLFGKIGQILSTRQDLLGKEVCKKLKKLQNHGTPLPYSQILSLLKKEYQDFPFKKIIKKPLGVGTIAQVHEAQLKNSQKVVIKIVRPHSRDYLLKDIKAVEFTLDILGLLIPDHKIQIIRAPLLNLLDSLKNEIDLLVEANNLEDLKKKTLNKQVYIPKVYKSFCTSNVLVMEKIEGKPLSSFGPRTKVAKEIGTMALKELLIQAFKGGLFHADPHPGNLFVMEDGRLAFIDLGLAGRFQSADRKVLLQAIKAFLSGDKDGSFKALLKLGVRPKKFDEAKFKSDISKIFQKHKNKISERIKNLDSNPNTVENFINELFLCAYKHGLYIPPSTSLLVKSLVTIEGVARNLNPDLKISEVVLSVVTEILTPKWLRWLY